MFTLIKFVLIILISLLVITIVYLKHTDETFRIYNSSAPNRLSAVPTSEAPPASVPISEAPPASVPTSEAPPASPLIDETSLRGRSTLFPVVPYRSRRAWRRPYIGRYALRPIIRRATNWWDMCWYDPALRQYVRVESTIRGLEVVPCDRPRWVGTLNYPYEFINMPYYV